MPFDDNRVDTSGVDDRRGRGIGSPIALGGGGLGLVGLLLYVLVQVFGGDISLPAATDTGAPAQGTSDLSTRCNTTGAIDRYDDCYVVKSYNEINEVWTAELQRRGQTYSKPKLVFFEQGVQTGCGTASSQVGPFYCPPDQTVYIDLGFLAELQQRFGANGRYAQTYVIAHEVGHHLQTLFGTERQVAAARQRDPSKQQALSIATELQADCYAGVWSTLANKAGNYSLGEGQLDEALGAAAAVGDDRIQKQTQGRVDPETWTHGSSEQRRQWFLAGFQSARIESCDTFK
jgi:predicted metalloprotease